MKKIVKRGLSLLLVFAVCLSLLPALTITADAATVNYVKDGKYVYNWGTREETATFLSPMAEDFYEASNITYAELAALSGSATTSSVPSSALYKQLQSLMKGRQTYETSYDATRDLYKYTDCQQSGSWQNGQISSFYSGDPIGPAWDKGATWNREHTWPNSKGNASGNGENDIMMLRPTAKSENGSRGNKAYGESSTYYHPNSESGGKHDLRGDVARITLFVYTRWGNTGSMWGSSGVMESKEVLLKWVEEDPVDTWELGRNDSVQSITGTRNVFVDYPELIFVMFGVEIPEGMDTPSGNANTCVHEDSYAIEANAPTCTATGNTAGRYCNDCEKFYNGYTVIQALGHSYTSKVTPPTVTEQGYTTYTCNACGYSYKSDYTAALGSSYTVTFQVPTGVVAPTAMSCNSYGITLPAADVPEGEYDYAFAGWVTAPVEDTETKPSFYQAGKTFKTAQDTVLYALYTYVDGESNPDAGTYKKVTTAPTDWAGEYLIVYESSKYIFNSTLSDLDVANNYTATTITNNTISADVGDAYKITIAPLSGGGYSLKASNGKYFGQTTNANDLKFGNSTYKNTISMNADGTVNIISGGAYLRFNANDGQYRFRYYKSSTYTGQKAICLYKKEADAGIRYYSTLDAVIPCVHENTITSTVDATCTVDGSVAVTCDDCGEVISAQVIPAQGHDYFYACDAYCMNCGELTNSDAAHAITHVEAKAATCFEEGNIEYWYCTECGFAWLDEYLHQNTNLKAVILPKVLIAWEGTNVLLGEALAVNFVLNITQLNGVTGNYVVLTRTYADGTTDTVTIQQSEWIMDGNFAKVSYTNLAAKEMGDVITAVVYDAEGNVISETRTDSIETYALRMLGNEVIISDNEKRTMFVDMLNYGAAAQAYFGYNAANLVNAELTAEQAGWASEAVEISDSRQSSGCYIGTNLSLEEKIYLQNVFRVAYEEGMKATVSFTDHYGNEVEKTAELVVEGSFVKVRVDGMAIADYQTMVTCTLYGADGTVLGSATDSVAGYVARNANELQKNGVDLGDAIVKLGASAYGSFH